MVDYMTYNAQHPECKNCKALNECVMIESEHGVEIGYNSENCNKIREMAVKK